MCLYCATHTLRSHYKASLFMLYSKMITGCTEIHKIQKCTVWRECKTF